MGELDAGLALLSQVVREPRFDDGELRKTKARMTDDAEDVARSSGSFTAMWMVFKELYPEKHPYATYGLLPSHIAKVDGTQVRDFHRRFFVPKAATLVLAGDLDEAQGKELATRGVLVNAITPAAFDSPILQQVPQSHIDYMLAKIPMGRLGAVHEIAAMVCFMLSEECSFTTAATFDTSGGRTTF